MLHPPSHVASLNPEERLARIALASAPGIGSTRFFRLLETFRSAQAAMRASPQELHSLVGSAATGVLQRPQLLQQAMNQERITKETGGRIIVWGEDDYPERLKRMARPPTLLYLAGTSRLPRQTVGIVGRRAASGAGQEKAEKMAHALASAGLAVISGGAYGIDAAAHRGCLDAEGLTVCVLGSSLDRPYPQRHFRLFAKIAETGALLSIFSPDSEAKRANFIRRNAVIAALSDILVVVEAGARSGARSTALQAAGMGVPVAAMPGSLGTNRLLAEGALAVDSARDILKRLQNGGSERLGTCSSGPMSNISLTGDSRRLLDVLARSRGRTVGFLAWRTGLSMGRLAAALVELRLAGLAEQTPGGRWILVVDPIGIGQERDKGEEREHDETGSGRISGQGTNNREVPGP